MEVALTAASWLVSKALKTLADDFDQAKIASADLGDNVRNIKAALSYTLSLLHEAERRNVSGNHGLVVLLQQLNKLAVVAETVLDELDYFRIQDDIDGTHKAAAVVDGTISSYILHGGQAVRHVAGKWLGPCIPYCTACSSRGRGDHMPPASSKLVMDRVRMSTETKDLVLQLEPVCAKVATVLKLMLLDLKHLPNNNMRHDLEDETRDNTGQDFSDDGDEVVEASGLAQFFRQTIRRLSRLPNNNSLKVCAVIGPPGSGKTDFARSVFRDPVIEYTWDTHLHIDASSLSIFDSHKITKDIFNKLCSLSPRGKEIRESIYKGDCDKKCDDMYHLQSLIQQMLNSRSFLLVLDGMGICDTKENWENFVAPLTKGKGTCIVVTTQLPSVAATIGATELIKMDISSVQKYYWECFLDSIGRFKHIDQELQDIGRCIAEKLYGAPILAIKIVANLLKKKVTRQHWSGVLRSKVWENPNNTDDKITLALHLTYEPIEFHLKKCLPYCALFPAYYEFESIELIHLWMAANVIDSTDIGLEYLDDLVKYNILSREGSYFVMDPLHRKFVLDTSVDECLCIEYSKGMLLEVKPSVAHVSVITGDAQSDDAQLTKDFKRNLTSLKKKVNIANLRTLIIIGKYGASLADFLKEIFKEIKSLRILRLFVVSPHLVLHNFSKLIHLRSLTIQSDDSLTIQSDDYSAPMLDLVCNLYHLEYLNVIKCERIFNLPSNGLSRLVNLRRLLAHEELHSKIADVGKLKFLQELRRFEVKDSEPFRLWQLGKLTELGGSLSVHNLEHVKREQEAEEAELIFKRNLRELKLVWGERRADKEPAFEERVLEGLKPNPGLSELHIKNHGGAKYPTWLCDSYFKRMEYINLHNVSWSILPPFVNMPNLKVLKLDSMLNLQCWDRVFRGHQFHGLRELSISNCPMLTELPFPDLSSLGQLEIKNCVKLKIGDSDFRTWNSLEKLVVYDSDKSLENSVAADLIKALVVNGGVKLKELETDNISGVLLACICDRLSHSLRLLSFRYDDQLQCFTEEQEGALLLLTSLRELWFQCCNSLRSVPCLQDIHSLQKSVFCSCSAIQSLPDDEQVRKRLWHLDIHSGCHELPQCKQLQARAVQDIRFSRRKF